jgi:hypothetical protein
MLCERTSPVIPFSLELSAVQVSRSWRHILSYPMLLVPLHRSPFIYLYPLADVEEGGFLDPGAS